MGSLCPPYFTFLIQLFSLGEDPTSCKSEDPNNDVYETYCAREGTGLGSAKSSRAQLFGLGGFSLSGGFSTGEAGDALRVGSASRDCGGEGGEVDIRLPIETDCSGV